MLGFYLASLVLLAKSGHIEMAIMGTPSPASTGTPLSAPLPSPLEAPFATGAPSSQICTPDQCCSCTTCAIGIRRSLQTAKKMCDCDAVCYYFNGGGKDLDLSQTGLVQDVTDRWQNQELTNIQKYVCDGGASGKTWSINRPPFSSCDWWIGGFTLTLKNIVQVEPCKYQATLTMYDPFEKPLDINSWICWKGELPFGLIFVVKYTWTIDIVCPGCGPSKPAPKPAPVAPFPKTTNPAPKQSGPASEPFIPARTPTGPLPKPVAPVPKPRAPVTNPGAPIPSPRAPLPKPVVPVTNPVAPLPKPLPVVVAPVRIPSAPVPTLAPPIPKPDVSLPKPIVRGLPAAPKPSIAIPKLVIGLPAPKPNDSITKPALSGFPAPKQGAQVPKPSSSLPKPVISPKILSTPLGTNTSKI